jgi:arylsulfatase
VHAIDVTPTILELIGITPPDTINGFTQTPIEGVSFAHTLGASDAPSKHVTQYYEMFGSRALYHDGWKAVVFHPAPAIAYDGTDVSKPFDADAWELYHVAEDFSEVRDLAAAEPAKLEQMKQLWWDEAVKYQVLPLNNQPGRFGDRRYRRDRHELHAGIGPLPEVIAPNLRGRKFFIAAELDVPASGDVAGAIVAHGSHSGGYVLFVRGRRLHYAYNFVGTEITVATANVELPAGRVVVRVAFSPSSTKLGSGGDVALFYGDVPVGEATIARTTPLTYGSHGFAVGYQPGGPICADLPGRAEMPPGVLGRVVIESEGRAARDAAARTRVDLATQ